MNPGDTGAIASGHAPVVQRYPSAAEFLAELGPRLEEREDENNLVLGVATARRAAEASGFDAPPALFARVGPGEAPRAVLMMTPPFPLSITPISGDFTDLAREVADAIADIPLPVGGVLAPDEMSDAFRDVWARRGFRVRETMRERLHRIDTVEAVPMRPGHLVVAGPDHFPLLVDWVQAFQAEALPDEPPRDYARSVGLRIEQGDYFVWEEGGVPLGMAARARRTRRGISINSVYTPPEHRGKGVALSCVAALTRLLLQDVDFCVLYTDLSNPTSNGIYRRIGYRAVRDFTLHWFEVPQS